MDTHILEDCPQLLRDYLFYMETIKGRSANTISGYYIDLRMFFRFLKVHRGLVPQCDAEEFNHIKIVDIGAELVRSVTLSDAYAFLNFTLSQNHNTAKTRSRKISSLRSFYKYLTNKAGILEENPLENLETPALRKSVPKYLSLEESLELLNHVDTSHSERDYCIITFFLNCGMRLSELVGINLSDLHDNHLTILGKGNKERVIYLNEACMSALKDYLKVRNANAGSIKDKNALFLSRLGTRINKRRVQQIIESALKAANLDGKGFSTHKLRHTAATLMYQHGGVDVRVLQEILGHENLGTTEIYTHISNRQVEQAVLSSPLSGTKRKAKKADLAENGNHSKEKGNN